MSTPVYDRRAPFPPLGLVGFKGLMWLAHQMTIGAAGAISSQTVLAKGGVTAVQTATKTGRYTYTLPAAYKHLFLPACETIGPTDAIYGANTTGYDHFWRNNNVDSGTKVGTIDLQFTEGTDNADALPPSGLVIMCLFAVGRGA